MKPLYLRLLLVATITLISAFLLILPTWHTPTAAQNGSDPESVSITLLYPHDTNGNQPQFTIRVDDDIDRLDLSTMNFRWFNGVNESRFDLNGRPEIRDIAEMFETGFCIQLYLVQPNIAVPLCNNTVPYPVRPQTAFWTPNLTSVFSVYQGDTLRAQCSTTNDRCTFNWPLVINIDGSDNPNLTLYPTPDTLTLFIQSEEPIDRTGLRFQVEIDNVPYTVDLDAWAIPDIVNPHDCYVFTAPNALINSPADCRAVIPLRLENDNLFWYDTTENLPRNIDILNANTLIGTCPTQAFGCTFRFEVAESPILSPTPPPTFTPQPSAVPSVTPRPTNTTIPNGDHLQVFYDDAHLHLWNRENHEIVVSRISFAAVEPNDIPTGRSFDGSLWAEFYAFLDTNNGCTQIDTGGGTSIPSECSVINARVLFENQPFWVEHGRAAEFIVYWDEVEVARCPLATDDDVLRCDIYVSR